MDGERILYPCYFNKDLKRCEGRRVPLSLAVEKPSTKAIRKAAKKLGLTGRIEEASHPGHWLLREGRVIVEWTEGKEELIKKVAEILQRGA